MVVLQILVALIVGYITKQVFSYLKNVAAVKNWPGVRQPISPSSLLGRIKSFPDWLAPVRFGFGNKFKWENFYKLYGRDILTCVSPSKVYFLVADADIIKEITTTRVEHFPKPVHNYKLINIFGKNVVSTESTEWKRHRKITSVGFSERNNRLVCQETVKYALAMVNELKRRQGDKGGAVIDIVPYTLKIALCVISSASFGIDADWDNHDVLPPGRKMTFFQALETITTNPLPFILVPRWALSLPISNFRTVKTATEEYTRYIADRISAMRAEKDVDRTKLDDRRGDLFSTLIKTADGEKDDDLKLSDSELAGNVYVLMLAGHETTAHTLSFAFGLLALYPEVQEEFYKEIKSVLGDRDVPEYEDFMKLKYAHAIMNETLRLYPIVSAIPKWAPKDTTLDNGKITVPAGSNITLHVAGLHYNEKYWGPDVKKFKPSRFLGDYNKDAFIPFSDGARACMGKRFSQLETVFALTVLVRNFKITCEEKDQKVLLEPTQVLTLVPKNPVMLKFVARD